MMNKNQKLAIQNNIDKYLSNALMNLRQYVWRYL